MRKEYNFIIWLRCLGMFLILMCHYVQESTNTILSMSSQFFNIGVDIFFLISGFLFGIQKIQSGGVLHWYKKRLKRIYVPYEIFVISLGIITLIIGGTILKMDWLWLALGLQGSVVGVRGAGQTWFITVLLLCYLLTPVMLKAIDALKNAKKLWILFIVSACFPAIWAMFTLEWVSTIFSPLSIYVLALIIGRCFDSIKLNKPLIIPAFFIMLFSFTIRILGKMLFDDTALYNRGIVTYTQVIVAFCIFYMFAVVFRKSKPFQGIEFISSISYEVYLLHYMFCVGPVRLFSLTSSWLLNCMIVTIITILAAFGLHKISALIIRKLI